MTFIFAENVDDVLGAALESAPVSPTKSKKKSKITAESPHPENINGLEGSLNG